MQIEEGKFYRTRDGRKVGPMGRWLDDKFDCEPEYTGEFWEPDGINGNGHSTRDEHLDLVAEWSDTPPLLGELTDAEIVQLMRDYEYGNAAIQSFHHGEWFDDDLPRWVLDVAYRRKPEPVRETLDVYEQVTSLGFGQIGTIDRIDGVLQPDTFKLL